MSDSPQLSGFALWLCPADPVRSQLADMIRAVAEREGTPPFLPHLTLLGAMAGPEALRRRQTETLALGLAPIPLALVAVTASPEYFRNVALEVESTPALMQARQRAIEVFDYPAAGAYHPHLSLIYGSLPTSRLPDIASELAHLVNLSVAAATLELVSLEGVPDAWRSVVVLPLEG